MRFSSHSAGPFYSSLRDLKLAAGGWFYRTFYAWREQQKRFVCFRHLQFGLRSAGARSSDGLVSVECELIVSDEDSVSK